MNPKAMDVLVYLASQSGEVCSKEEIFEEVWAQTFVTETVLTSAVWELRKALGDDARNPRVIATIPKRGYRLLLPAVAVEEASRRKLEVPGVERGVDPARRPRRWLVAALVLVLGALVATVVVDRRQLASGTPETGGEASSIGLAVLPFENNTGDEQLDWLRQGLPDMLAFDLGRSEYLRVVSLEAVSGILDAERGSPVGSVEAIRRVQEETGAQVVVTGRILLGEDRFRILAQLHDFATGTLRSEEVEGDSSNDVLALADQISRRIRVALELDASDLPGAEEGLARTPTDSVEAYKSFVEGKLALERLQFREAVAELQHAIELDPEFAHAYEALANAYDILGQKELAQEAIGHAVAALDGLPRAGQLLILRRQAQLQNDTTAELELLEQLVALRPREAPLRARLAWFQMVHRRDCEQSIVTYREAIALEAPAMPYFYAYLAEAYLSCSDPAAAREALAEYARRLPDDVTTFHHLGHLFYLVGDYSRAIEQLEIAIEREPGFAPSYGLLGDVRSAQGRYEEGEALYRDALNRAAGPSDQENVLLSLGELSLDRGQWESTLDFAEQALEIRPDSVRAMWLVGLAEIGRGQIDQASAVVERLQEILGRTESRYRLEFLHHLRGSLALANELAEEAIREFELALAVKPMNLAPYWQALATAQVAAGDSAAAEASFNRLFDVNPGYARGRCAYGELLDQRGQPVLARAEYARCLETWEGDERNPEWVQRAKNRVGGAS